MPPTPAGPARMRPPKAPLDALPGQTGGIRMDNSVRHAAFKAGAALLYATALA